MPNTALPNLDAAGALDGTELTYITQTGESRKLTLAQLATYIKTAESITPTALPWRGCRVYRTSDITGITWPVIVSWQAENIDTDGIWSLGDATKLVVPAGVTKVRLTASIATEGVITAGSVNTGIRKNMTGTAGDTTLQQGTNNFRGAATSGFAGDDRISVTPVIDVVPGDFFDFRINVSMTGNDQILANNRTWFEMEIIEAIP